MRLPLENRVVSLGDTVNDYVFDKWLACECFEDVFFASKQ
jgi:hypothetical protein